ncbi:MAG: hypothetical protein HY925_04465, partial [Elusimicrobia bacterium]|nr:hypothetical protein [Elusimicrobiota bacterium]
AAPGAADAQSGPESNPLAGIGEPGQLPDGVADAVGAAGAADLAQFGKLSDLKSAFGRNSAFGGGGMGAQGNFSPRNMSAKLPPKERFGKGASLASARGALQAKNLMRIAGRTNKAMGQLKMSNYLSGRANNAREEAAAQYSADAFEQTKTQGGEMPALLGPTAGVPPVVIPQGPGAPDPTVDPPPAPPVGPIVNATPYQPNLDALKAMGDMAGQMKMMSIMMIIAGIALIIAGTQTAGWGGWALIIAGLALVASGVMMAASAANMAAQAKQMANSIVNQQYGQKDQAQIAADTAEAKSQNRPYTPPDLSNKTNRNEGVKTAVDEEKNATYQFDDGSQH